MRCNHTWQWHMGTRMWCRWIQVQIVGEVALTFQFMVRIFRPQCSPCPSPISQCPEPEPVSVYGYKTTTENNTTIYILLTDFGRTEQQVTEYNHHVYFVAMDRVPSKDRLVGTEDRILKRTVLAVLATRWLGPSYNFSVRSDDLGLGPKCWVPSLWSPQSPVHRTNLSLPFLLKLIKQLQQSILDASLIFLLCCHPYLMNPFISYSKILNYIEVL